MKNLLIYVSLVTSVMLLFAGCTTGEKTLDDTQTSILNSSQKLTNHINASVAEAKDLIESNGLNDDFVILDVRTPEEYSEGCLDNSTNVDYSSPDFAVNAKKLAKDKTYLVYCRSGRRSAASSKILDDLGFEHVYNLKGGISAWVQSGQSVKSSC